MMTQIKKRSSMVVKAFTRRDGTEGRRAQQNKRLDIEDGVIPYFKKQV
jgi:hypothetical protein